MFLPAWGGFIVAGVILGYAVIRLIDAELVLLEVWAGFSVVFGGIIATIAGVSFKCSNCRGELASRLTGVEDRELIICNACKRYELIEVDHSA